MTTNTNTNGLLLNSSLWGPISASSSSSHEFISPVTSGPALSAKTPFLAGQIQVVNTFKCDGICNAFEFSGYINVKLDSASAGTGLYFFLSLNPLDLPTDPTFALGGWGIYAAPGTVTSGQMNPGLIRSACLTGQTPPSTIYLQCYAGGACQFDSTYVSNYLPENYGNSAAYVRGWVTNIQPGN